MVAAIVPGVLIGTALGLLGGGGSVLTVPIFVYVLGFDPKAAIAMSLAVVGTASVVGTVAHWRAGRVNLRIGALFGAVAMLGTLGGARLGLFLAGTTQLLLFGVVMLAAAGIMLRGGTAHASEKSGDAGLGRTVAPLVMGGLFVGLLTGVVGVGGGFLIVPALLFIRVPLPEAIGTSLLIIAANCAIGVWSYLGQVEIAWTAVALVTASMVPGIAFGTYLHRFVPQRLLRGGFAVFLAVMAAFILYQNVNDVTLGD